jgi:hypothetical protein
MENLYQIDAFSLIIDLVVFLRKESLVRFPFFPISSTIRSLMRGKQIALHLPSVSGCATDRRAATVMWWPAFVCDRIEQIVYKEG